MTPGPGRQCGYRAFSSLLSRGLHTGAPRSLINSSSPLASSPLCAGPPVSEDEVPSPHGARGVSVHWPTAQACVPTPAPRTAPQTERRLQTVDIIGEKYNLRLHKVVSSSEGKRREKTHKTQKRHRTRFRQTESGPEFKGLGNVFPAHRTAASRTLLDSGARQEFYEFRIFTSGLFEVLSLKSKNKT